MWVKVNPQFLPLSSEVKLTKLEATNVIPGMLNEGYWLQGILVQELKIGKTIKVLRHTRNGIKMTGIYESTPLTKIDGDKFYTQNSIWKIEQV